MTPRGGGTVEIANNNCNHQSPNECLGHWSVSGSMDPTLKVDCHGTSKIIYVGLQNLTSKYFYQYYTII